MINEMSLPRQFDSSLRTSFRIFLFKFSNYSIIAVLAKKNKKKKEKIFPVLLANVH